MLEFTANADDFPASNDSTTSKILCAIERFDTAILTND